MKKRFPLILCLALFSAGCDDASKSTTKSGSTVEETGKDISKNPIAALGQLAKFGEEMAEKAKKMEEKSKKKPLEPLGYEELIAFLPVIEGWKSAEPKGSTNRMGEWKISEASRSFKSSKDGKNLKMKVEIIDGNYVPMVYMPFTMMSKFSQESTEGHKKGLAIDGHPAFEEWTKKSQRLKLLVLVQDRFLITIEGRNVVPTLAREWVGMMDLKKLQKLAGD